MHINPIAIALTAAALALTPSVVSAEAQQRTIGVVYSDLDLSTEDGRVELDQRINRAARLVCRLDETTVGTRIRSREARNCFTQAKRDLDQHFAGILRDSQQGG